MTSLLDSPRPRNHRRARLLIVEDDLSTVFALRSFFALAGYDVDCAKGLTEGVSHLERQSYEAVITDLQLTRSRRHEGLDIAGCARRRNPGACVVMLTAYGTDEIEEEARRCGVDVYRTKPVELPQLTGDIERVLAGHGWSIVRVMGAAILEREDA